MANHFLFIRPVLLWTIAMLGFGLAACDVTPVATDYKNSRQQASGNQSSDNQRQIDPINDNTRDIDNDFLDDDDLLEEAEEIVEEDNEPVITPQMLAMMGQTFMMESGCLGCHVNPGADPRLQRNQAQILAGVNFPIHDPFRLANTWPNADQATQIVEYIRSLSGT